jgi:PKD repeat protein
MSRIKKTNMKKLILILGLAASTTLVIYSCKKKLNDSAEQGITENAIGNNARVYTNVTYENGMIRFKDHDVFDAIYDKMVKDRKNQVITYPENDYYRDADPVLEDFEAQFPEHNSIRKQVKMAQRAEVDAQTENSNELRLTRSWIGDPIINTFMNSKNQFRIGNSIYYWKNFRTMLIVLDGNTATLNALQNTENINQFKNVAIKNMGVGKFTNKVLPQFNNASALKEGTDTCSKLRSAFNTNITHASKNVAFVFTGSNWSGNTYDWDFGDGSANSTVQSPSHTYAAFGDYTVTLIVYNPGTGCTQTTEKMVKIGECKANFNSYAGQNGIITFNASPSNSSLPITSYIWTFGDGTTATTTTPVTTHTYTCDGDFAAGLTLVSGTCSGSSSATVNTVSISTYNCCQKDYNVSCNWQIGPNYATDKRIEYNVSQENRDKAGFHKNARFVFHAELENWELRKLAGFLWKRWLKTTTNMEISVNGIVYGKDQNKCGCQIPYSLSGGTGQISDYKRDHEIVVPLLNGNNLKMKLNNEYTVQFKINGNLVKSWNNNASFLCDQ